MSVDYLMISQLLKPLSDLKYIAAVGSFGELVIRWLSKA